MKKILSKKKKKEKSVSKERNARPKKVTRNFFKPSLNDVPASLINQCNRVPLSAEKYSITFFFLPRILFLSWIDDRRRYILVQKNYIYLKKNCNSISKQINIL